MEEIEQLLFLQSDLWFLIGESSIRTSHLLLKLSTKEVIEALNDWKQCILLINSPTTPSLLNCHKSFPNSWIVKISALAPTIYRLVSKLHKVRIVCDFNHQRANWDGNNWIAEASSQRKSIAQFLLNHDCSRLPITPHIDATLLPNPKAANTKLQPPSKEVHLLPRLKVSSIIGFGGKEIQNIRRDSGCEITIESMSDNKFNQLRTVRKKELPQRIEMVGTSEQIMIARAMMNARVKD